MPFQYNYNDGFGPQDGHQSYVNVQPVIPFSLNADWNVIVRTIVPVISQDDVVPGTGSQFGLGNTTQSLFLSPKKPGPSGIVWGVGPAFLWPTATEDELGPDKWGAGPTVVALKQAGPVDRRLSRQPHLVLRRRRRRSATSAAPSCSPS